MLARTPSSKRVRQQAQEREGGNETREQANYGADRLGRSEPPGPSEPSRAQSGYSPEEDVGWAGARAEDTGGAGYGSRDAVGDEGAFRQELEALLAARRHPEASAAAPPPAARLSPPSSEDRPPAPALGTQPEAACRASPSSLTGPSAVGDEERWARSEEILRQCKESSANALSAAAQAQQAADECRRWVRLEGQVVVAVGCWVCIDCAWKRARGGRGCVGGGREGERDQDLSAAGC